MKTTEGRRIQRVHKFPAWMKQGFGVGGGGDFNCLCRVNGVLHEIYTSHRGINGTIATPGYFCTTGEPTMPDPDGMTILRVDKFDMTQEWWRLHKDDY